MEEPLIDKKSLFEMNADLFGLTGAYYGGGEYVLHIMLYI